MIEDALIQSRKQGFSFFNIINFLDEALNIPIYHKKSTKPFILLSYLKKYIKNGKFAFPERYGIFSIEN